MSSEDLRHSINNQLAVVMGKAELLGLKVGNPISKQLCKDIQLAAARINKLLYDYLSVHQMERAS